MNVRMWEHPSTKENIQKLRNFGYQIIGPENGDMACGEYGQGKMTEPTEIVSVVEQYFLNLKKIIILKLWLQQVQLTNILIPLDIFQINQVENKVMKLQNH